MSVLPMNDTMSYLGGGGSQREAQGVYVLGSLASATLSPEDAALRAGRAYTISSGLMTIAAGNYGGLMINNPAGSGRRIFITHRIFSCDLPDSAVKAKFFGTANPTTNMPPTVMTPSNRGAGGASVVTARGGVTNAVPTGGSTPLGNVLGGGGYVDFVFDRTLEPGSSFENYIVGVSTGLTGVDMQAVITFSFYEEAI